MITVAFNQPFPSYNIRQVVVIGKLVKDLVVHYVTIGQEAFSRVLLRSSGRRQRRNFFSFVRDIRGFVALPAVVYNWQKARCTKLLIRISSLSSLVRTTYLSLQ